MTMHTSPLGKLRSIVVIICLLVILGIFGYAYLTTLGDTVLDKDTVTEKTENLKNDPDYNYVSSYLRECGIGNIKESKINNIENILENNFYKDLPDEKVLAERISLLFLEYFYDNIDLEDQEAVTDAVLKCLFVAIEDPYANYRTAKEFEEYISYIEGGSEFVGIGIIIDQNSLVIMSVFNGAGADAAGIKRGDKLHGVGDKTVNDTDKEALINLLAGEDGSTVDITVERDGELITFNVTRARLTEVSVTYNMEDDRIGYIMITQFVSSTPDEFKAAVDYLIGEGALGLVIDLRNNPGGLVDSAMSTIDYLVPDGDGIEIGSYTYPGGEYVYYANDGHHVRVPIAVLCNGGTASASELFAGAMRDFNDAGIIDCVIIGDTTYGKGVVQTSYNLSDGSGITYTIGYCNPPSRVNCNGVGIEPDIFLPEDYVNNTHVEVATEEIYKMLSKTDDIGFAA